MIKFIVRRLALMLLTMLIVSVMIFIMAEISPGNIARNVLGAYVTPAQEASYMAQLGFDRPVHIRYISWLLGNDWQAERVIRMNLQRMRSDRGYLRWWVVDDGDFLRWKMEERDLIAIRRLPDGTTEEFVDNDRWQEGEDGSQYFWGVDTDSRAVKWIRSAEVMPTGGVDVRFSDRSLLRDTDLEDESGRPSWLDAGTPQTDRVPANEWVSRNLNLGSLSGKSIDAILVGLDYRRGDADFPVSVSVFVRDVRIVEESPSDTKTTRFEFAGERFSGEFLESQTGGDGELEASIVQAREAGVGKGEDDVFRIAGPVVAEQAYAVYSLFSGLNIPVQENTELHYKIFYSSPAAPTVWEFGIGGWVSKRSGAVQYIPLKKGFLRGDPGRSIRTGRPVMQTLTRRLRNSLFLAGIAFAIVMPLALILGLVAGLNNGGFIDRFLSLFGLVTTSTPSFATGVVLILVLSSWLELLPGATTFSSDTAIFRNLDMLIMPVLTLTLVELGYVLRITRSSIVEVMREPYIRTASLKGLPYFKIVTKHALRNALIAPLTVILLHVNWLIGGVVVVESVFGFPGLGKYLYDSAVSKDVFALEAGAMIMVVVAVSSQLIADVAYTFLNPRIRYGAKE
jgi:ABC-type dipeptide/oligopeptide/nickel transport system permease component